MNECLDLGLIPTCVCVCVCVVLYFLPLPLSFPLFSTQLFNRQDPSSKDLKQTAVMFAKYLFTDIFPALRRSLYIEQRHHLCYICGGGDNKASNKLMRCDYSKGTNCGLWYHQGCQGDAPESKSYQCHTCSKGSYPSNTYVPEKPSATSTFPSPPTSKMRSPPTYSPPVRSAVTSLDPKTHPLASTTTTTKAAILLPTKLECASPGCEGADSSKLLRCCGCRKTYYCGKACQIAHWEAGHNLNCTTDSEVGSDKATVRSYNDVPSKGLVRVLLRPSMERTWIKYSIRSGGKFPASVKMSVSGASTTYASHARQGRIVFEMDALFKPRDSKPQPSTPPRTGFSSPSTNNTAADTLHDPPSRRSVFFKLPVEGEKHRLQGGGGRATPVDLTPTNQRETASLTQSLRTKTRELSLTTTHQSTPPPFPTERCTVPTPPLPENASFWSFSSRDVPPRKKQRVESEVVMVAGDSYHQPPSTTSHTKTATEQHHATHPNVPDAKANGAGLNALAGKLFQKRMENRSYEEKMDAQFQTRLGQIWVST